ncbi:Phospholipid scramblase [Rhynchospora pubera]|uniref:Phospholipid scramblase n=1 Tax=Rhynchospora pubera TaxID=906938 RepID=A0AAV8CEN5_9POAL|nr:Phospholipid scramblase [Rhynchospora pubera]
MRWRWCLRKTSCSSSSSSSSSSYCLSPSNEIIRRALSLGPFPHSDSRHFGSLSSGAQGKGQAKAKAKGGSSAPSSSSVTVTRDWLAQLWKHELKQHCLLKKEQPRNHSHSHSHSHSTADGGAALHGFLAPFSSAFQLPFFNHSKLSAPPPTPPPPPPPQAHSTGAAINFDSLLSRNNLVVARDIEWANVLFSFEQESRYVIMDAAAPNSPVAYIRETSNLIYRQLLRSRRPFVAHIIDSHGNEIFRVRRPFWLINSTIFAEVDGKEIGVVHRRWHLWRRIYDLYLGNRQFAVVENPGFWNWTFTLKDEEDNVLAEIDRNWRGIGLELFTDAGQYVIRFGALVPGSYGSDNHIEELNVVRPLTLSERAVALALAVSLDCDYFSRRGGWGLPIIILEE